MPAILTLNRLNLSNIIRFQLGLYVVLSGLTLFYKIMAYRAGGAVGSIQSFDVPILQLIPNQTVFNPWTLVTSSYVETNIWKFIISIPIFYQGLNFLNKSWDNSNLNFDASFFSNEINKYLFFCILFTNIVTVLNYIVFAILLEDNLILRGPINHGLLSIAMSFIVVLKQLKPEFEIKYIQLRLKHLPFLVYVCSIFLSVVFKSLTPFLPISNSFLISWYYLRFIQKDYSSIFEFQSFFPDSIKFIVVLVIAPFGKIANFLNIIPTIDNNEVTLPKTSDVLERRRQVALKVLEESIGE